jgi:hypothetical protein
LVIAPDLVELKFDATGKSIHPTAHMVEGGGRNLIL